MQRQTTVTAFTFQVSSYVCIPSSCLLCLAHVCIVGFTLTVVNDFCGYLSQFSTNCLEIVKALFSSDAAPTF